MVSNYLKNNKIFIPLIVIYYQLFKYFIFLNNNKGHTFLTSDWLINYNYGFVKRGLPGTIFMNVTKNPDLLLDIISGTLITIYILIFFFLNKTFNSKKQNFVSYILIFSPTIFLFPIYDSQGGFRKEIIGILALFILTSFTKKRYYKVPIIISSIIYTFGLFSHSVNIFFLTTILFIIYKFYKSSSLFDYLIFVIPSILYIFVINFFSNFEQELYEIRNSICNDLRDMDLFNLCGHGSFDYLVWDLNANLLISQNFIINERREEYYLYIFLFLLSLIPFLFDKNFKNLIFPYTAIGTSFIPLFVVAIDWGRWIFIMFICFLAVYLLSEKEIIANKSYYLLIIYPIFFRIEHCCSPSFDLSISFILNNLDWLIFNFQNIFLFQI